MPNPNLRRPYLVIPKLIEQPTWGGKMIVTTKGWSHIEPINTMKIGQSYELFSGSNLSLLDSSDDPAFQGELTDRDAVATQSHPDASVALSEVIANDAKSILLIKYTQALGNSFQTHIKDGVKDPKWLPKPESWYYFEPGLITLGVKPGIDWDAYQAACEAIHDAMNDLSAEVKSGSITYDDAQPKIKSLLEKYDPWQYVNTIPIAKDQLVDLSAGGLHHSWEEDPRQAPHGNVLYELQAEALDPISTFRNFDKGKMEPDGSVRALQIQEYFQAINRSPAANDPAAHMQSPQLIRQTVGHSLSRLMTSRHYTLDKLTFSSEGATFNDKLNRFMHLFVKTGRIQVTSGGHSVIVGTAHSCFIPAGAQEYEIKNLSDSTEVLISY